MVDKLRVPTRYYKSKTMRKSDTTKQKKYLRKSRKLYKKGMYYQRPKVKSFKSRKSNHLNRLRKMYKVDTIGATKELSQKTQCAKPGLEEILSKGRGAYYSSGSRPNQTAESWAVARLASALTGGNSSAYDYHILKQHCKPTSKVLRLARKTCKKLKRKCGD
jgi:hypothetical protein